MKIWDLFNNEAKKARDTVDKQSFSLKIQSEIVILIAKMGLKLNYAERKNAMAYVIASYLFGEVSRDQQISKMTDAVRDKMRLGLENLADETNNVILTFNLNNVKKTVNKIDKGN